MPAQFPPPQFHGFTVGPGQLGKRAARSGLYTVTADRKPQGFMADRGIVGCTVATTTTTPPAAAATATTTATATAAAATATATLILIPWVIAFQLLL